MGHTRGTYDLLIPLGVYTLNYSYTQSDPE